MRRWISLFAFSLLVIGGVLAYETFRVLSDPGHTRPLWQIGLLILGAAAGLILGIIGLAERHRRRQSRYGRIHHDDQP